ncbi:MAG: efflux RND transporter periplasmic adaptor subunit [Sphingobacteriales bacterium]|nr:MAG: efflux RND transporter periplasmic adaptor subunit [Sphingobacteriales bacterium]
MNSKIAGIFTIVTLAAILSACGGKDANKPQQAAPPAIPVSLYAVQSQSVKGVDQYPGTIVPLVEVELRAEVNGYITGIFVKDGQSVKKGQKLYEVDQSRYAATYRQLNAQVQIAKANLARVTKDVERYTRLSEQDAIAKQRVDYANADQQTAKSQVAAAEANLANAATDLARSVIKAPMNGTIGIAPVRLGSLVSAGTTLINTVSSPDPIAVDIAIGEGEIQRFIKLQVNPPAKSDSTFSLVLPDKSVFGIPGKITAIDRAVDPQTGTLKVRVTFPNPGNRLRAGMNCLVRVANSDAGNQLTIPNKALTEQLGEFFVYVLGDSNKVAQRRVNIGSRFNDMVVVREGLKEGEQIVSDGVQNLRPGAVVNPNGPGGPGGAGMGGTNAGGTNAGGGAAAASADSSGGTSGARNGLSDSTQKK